jgi:hypothetical protein
MLNRGKLGVRGGSIAIVGGGITREDDPWGKRTTP